MAKESNLDLDNKFTNISWKKQSEILIILTIININYILHITNQASLFTSALKPYKRSIRVRGGKLWLIGIRIIIINPENKRFILLENTLFISNLGYIFILARKLAISKYIGSFNKEYIIFI